MRVWMIYLLILLDFYAIPIVTDPEYNLDICKYYLNNKTKQSININKKIIRPYTEDQ